MSEEVEVTITLSRYQAKLLANSYRDVQMARGVTWKDAVWSNISKMCQKALKEMED